MYVQYADCCEGLTNANSLRDVRKLRIEETMADWISAPCLFEVQHDVPRSLTENPGTINTDFRRREGRHGTSRCSRREPPSAQEGGLTPLTRSTPLRRLPRCVWRLFLTSIVGMFMCMTVRFCPLSNTTGRRLQSPPCKYPRLLSLPLLTTNHTYRRRNLTGNSWSLVMPVL